MEATAMFFLMVLMVAIASCPLGFGIGRSIAQRSRTSIRPMHRCAR
jgi:hypothetical protein